MRKLLLFKLTKQMVCVLVFYVQPNDGGALQTYAIQFLQEAPQIERLSLEVENADALKEDQTVGIKVFGTLSGRYTSSLES